jgi:Fur family ferric uptake transcriptional regulator
MSQFSKPSVLPCGRPIPETQSYGQPVLQALKLRLEQFAAEKQLNRSEAREKILETIVKESRHFRPLDLLARLGKRFPEVGRATFYRNLPIFVESGILKEGPQDSDGQTFYELSTTENEEHHDHIVCVDCGRIFEFHDHAIESRQVEVSKNLGFSAKKHSHVIYADCDYKK